MVSVVEQLASAGLSVKPYARGPERQNMFVVSVDPSPKGRGTLRLWPGTSKIEVAADKRLHQAVLTVTEPSRTITKSFRRWDPSEADAKRNVEAGRGFPIGLPEGTTYRLLKISLDDSYTATTGGSRYWFVDVEAKTKKTTQTFLVGIDEHHHFVSALPKRAATVREAHEVLRPKEVPVGSPRQGEWFFVRPAQKILDELEAQAGSIRARWLDGIDHTDKHSGIWDGSRTTHWAPQTLRYKNAIYVCGYVIESRQSRHDPLYLTEWHRVYRNTELVTESQSARWD